MQDKIEILKGFLAEDPNDSFSRFALALELVKLEKFDEAIKAFRTIETNDEKYVATYYHLGKALESVRKKDEAVETYEKRNQNCRRTQRPSLKSRTSRCFNECNNGLLIF